MRLTICHSTTYIYDSPDHYALQQVRLRPQSGPGQTVLSWDTRIEGGARQLSYEDHNGNHVDLVVIEQGAMEVRVISEGTVEVEDRAGVVGKTRGHAPLWLYDTAPPEQPATQPGPHLRKLAQTIKSETHETALSRLHALSAAILSRVAYDKGQTDSTTTAEAALAAGHGVCQDHSQIFIACARLLGFPARYVSGYLLMQDRVEQDATHAWAEAWIDPLGWVGFDVSNGISPDARYVRIATGRDYAEAAPIHGLRLGQGSEALSVALKVQAETAQ